MKNTLTLSIFLLAGGANAQYRPIVPSFPGANNPIVSLPRALPNPLSGPLAEAPIRLPAPSVLPPLRLAPSVLPAAAVHRVLPAVIVQFAARQDEPKNAAAQDAEKDDLDRIFDGEPPPAQRPSRRINIPERELERELGL